MADPGGCHQRMPPPQQDPFLLLLHIFLLKSVRIGGWHPPNGLAPLQREILHPPLYAIDIYLGTRFNQFSITWSNASDSNITSTHVKINPKVMKVLLHFFTVVFRKPPWLINVLNIHISLSFQKLPFLTLTKRQVPWLPNINARNPVQKRRTAL